MKVDYGHQSPTRFGGNLFEVGLRVNQNLRTIQPVLGNWNARSLF
jgi:hypothetical protein